MTARVLSTGVRLLVAAVVIGWGVAYAENLLHARISFDSGGSLVRGTDDADWSFAKTNSLILPGDTLWIDKEGTLETEFSSGTFLRVADRFVAGPDPSTFSAPVVAPGMSYFVHRQRRSQSKKTPTSAWIL